MTGSRSAAFARGGVLYGIAAYGSWGLFPLYFKALATVPPLEVLAHRALWSFVLLAVVVGLLRRWGALWRQLHSRRLLRMLGLSTLFIAANWLTFIYSVTSGQVLQSSLGYFISPLVNVLLGVVFLRERLRRYQTLSIGLALAGVLVLTAMIGEIPWIALVLAITFALYGLMRKIIPIDGLFGLTVETMILAPVALAYLCHVESAGPGDALGHGRLGLLVLSGPMTTVPLLFFAAAARRLRLSTLGILQYLSPSLQFLLAVAAFGETFAAAHVVSFACIWTAIAIYTADSWHARRQQRLALVEPAGADL